MVEPLDKKKLDLLLKKLATNFPLVVNLSHQKGGVGKSTLAYNIADSFRILGYKVKLLDVDIQNTCGGLNGLRETPFEDIEKVADEARLVELINDSSTDGSEILIIDTGGFDSALSRLAIMGSDINLTPVSDKVTEVLAVVQKYSQTLGEIEMDTDTDVSSYVLLNRIHPFAKHFEHIEEMIEESAQMDMFKSIVRDRSIYDKSFIDGRTIFEAPELKGHENAMDEMLSVCYELIEIHVNKG
ncbi:MAG: Plasmid partitioning protein ParA [uncultured Sulfurovum sp.]|uniref:Plasmid partitioning protein ParA n=1 Tax=uncultured Sulfurovum sp. TaxID=269237 RepID=A0A6S6SWJ1_9BACT|nr:MAG: Plasmid partitioning protein ParA [uncultured Sulfurovum sp.]